MSIHTALPTPRRRTLRRTLLTLTLTLLSGGVAGPVVAGAADPPRYKTYYSIFDRGRAEIPGHDTRWVPQGLAYWPERDALIISYYDGEEKKRSRLAVIDRSSGRRLQLFELPNKGHVGALAMSDNYLWVGDSGVLNRYGKARLGATGALPRLASDGSYPVKASSYMTIVGKKLWVGDYNKTTSSKAYRYTLAKGGVPRDDKVSITAPQQAQGMAIAGDKVIWSRSTGADNDSLLDVGPLRGGLTKRVLAPNMSEGIVIAGGELHVLYESGAAKYSGADYRVRTVHHGPLAALLG